MPRRVLGVRNRSVTRNCGEGLQIWVKHGSFADATLLRVNERGEYRFYPKVRPYTPFLRRNATYITRFLFYRSVFDADFITLRPVQHPLGMRAGQNRLQIGYAL